MPVLSPQISRPLLAFLLPTILLIGVESLIAHTTTLSQHKSVLSVGILFDLVFIPTTLFYWLIARPLCFPVSRLLVVALLMLRIALFILPEASFLPERFWPFLLVSVEGTALLVAGLRFRTIVRTYRQLRLSNDAGTSLQGSLAAVFGERAAGFILGEGRVLYYALLGWRLQPDVPAGAKTLTTHKESGQIALTIALLLVGLIENAAVHLLLARWNPTVSFWVTAFSVYGLLFFVANLIATLKRQTYLSNNQLQLRLGVFWQADIPRSAIADISLINEKPDKQPDLLNGAFLTAPNVLLTFTESIIFQGPYGIQKEIRRFSFFVDDRTGFRQLLMESR